MIELKKLNMILNKKKHSKNDLSQFSIDLKFKIYFLFFSQTSIHVKNYDLERRRLSADVTLHRSMLDLKQREGRKKYLYLYY